MSRRMVWTWPKTRDWFLATGLFAAVFGVAYGALQWVTVHP